MVNRWEAFERYLEHGAIPIDNNQTEASLKFPILGRKAWLFFGNENGGETAATLFTLTKSCNRHRVDPYAYLRDVYTRLPTLPESELDTLLPDRWVQQHPEHLIQERVDEAIQRAQRKRKKSRPSRSLSESTSLGSVAVSVKLSPVIVWKPPSANWLEKSSMAFVLESGAVSYTHLTLPTN